MRAVLPLCAYFQDNQALGGCLIIKFHAFPKGTEKKNKGTRKVAPSPWGRDAGRAGRSAEDPSTEVTHELEWPLRPQLTEGPPAAQSSRFSWLHNCFSDHRPARKLFYNWLRNVSIFSTCVSSERELLSINKRR